MKVVDFMDRSFGVAGAIGRCRPRLRPRRRKVRGGRRIRLVARPTPWIESGSFPEPTHRRHSMGIADFFRPKYRHSDVRVRTEAVKALTTDDAAILIQVARTDRDIGVRRIAIEKIEEAEALAEIAAAESERSLRDYAGERAAQLWSSAACSEDQDEASNALSGIVKLGDQHALVEVVSNAASAAIRKRAFGELRDPRALADLAKGDAPQDIRL